MEGGCAAAALSLCEEDGHIFLMSHGRKPLRSVLINCLHVALDLNHANIFSILFSKCLILVLGLDCIFLRYKFMPNMCHVLWVLVVGHEIFVVIFVFMCLMLLNQCTQSLSLDGS